MSTLDSVWATSNNRKEPEQDQPSTGYNVGSQAKGNLHSEQFAALPAAPATSTLDSRWATSVDTYKSDHGLPATRFSMSLAQRSADLHPEESNQPLTLFDESEDRTSRDWRSSENRTQREYNSFGRSSSNGYSSSRQQSSYRSPGYQETVLSANAPSWYPESVKREQRQQQPQQYEPVSARPWNMIAMKKKLPPVEASADPSRPFVQGRQTASWSSNNHSEMPVKPTAEEAWNEDTAQDRVSPPVVASEATTNTVSQSPHIQNPVLSTQASIPSTQASVQNSFASLSLNEDITVRAAPESTNDANGWDPTNVPWSEPESPKPLWKNDQNTKRMTWNTPTDQTSESYSTSQPYSITISLPSTSRTRPSDNSAPKPPPSQLGNEEPHTNSSPTANINPTQQVKETWVPATCDSEPQSPPSNRNTWSQPQSSSWQTQERPVEPQHRQVSDFENKNVVQEHQQTTPSSHTRRVERDEYVLPQNNNCRPWDVDKYKHRLWEQ